MKLTQTRFANRPSGQHPINVLCIGSVPEQLLKEIACDADIVVNQCPISIDEATQFKAQQAATGAPYEHIFVDVRDEQLQPASMLPLFLKSSGEKITILSSQEQQKHYEDLIAVNAVVPLPANIQNNIEKLPGGQADLHELSVALKRFTSETSIGAQHTTSLDHESSEIGVLDHDSNPSKYKVTAGFETSISTVKAADEELWRRFLPVANFVYKKLAITVLTALFLTFFTYGAKIVFYFTSTAWAMPYQLSKGHNVVQRVARDLSTLSVRKNTIEENIIDTKVKRSKAQGQKRDASFDLNLTKKIIQHEKKRLRDKQNGAKKEITRLSLVVYDQQAFQPASDLFLPPLSDSQAGWLPRSRFFGEQDLNELALVHRASAIESEIEKYRQSYRQATEDLRSLSQFIQNPNNLTADTSQHFSQQVSKLARAMKNAQTRLEEANVQLSAQEERLGRLKNSLQLVTNSIKAISNTPAARAGKSTLAVLFVPYPNLKSLNEGKILYSCAFLFVWCSPSGQIGPRIEGEVTEVHPLFGKPMRGIFVEALFHSQEPVTKEVVYAGRAPLFF